MDMTDLDNFAPTSASSAGPQTSTARASARAHAAIDTVAWKAKPRIDNAAAGAHKAIDRAQDAVAPAMQWVNVKVEKIRDTRDEALEGSRRRVKNDPVKAVGIAALFGFVVARLI